MSDIEALRNEMRSRLPEVIGDLRSKVRDRVPGAPPREAYRVDNADDRDGDTAVIRVYEEIWTFGVNADDFVRDLDTITAPKIRVEINSPGGDVFDAIAIYNALRTHPAHVTTRVDGIAASAASLIVQAGDRRQMLSSSQLMIHNAWGMTVGDSRDHDDMRALLEQQDDIIAGIYANRSDKDRPHFRTLMDAETWMSDQRAVEEGLADEVVDPPHTKTLNDEISEAMDVVSAAISSTERVAALRADAGKSLSVVNLESLDGLRDAIGRLEGLLADPDPGDGQAKGELAREYARFVATIQGV